MIYKDMYSRMAPCKLSVKCNVNPSLLWQCAASSIPVLEPCCVTTTDRHRHWDPLALPRRISKRNDAMAAFDGVSYLPKTYSHTEHTKRVTSACSTSSTHQCTPTLKFHTNQRRARTGRGASSTRPTSLLRSTADFRMHITTKTCHLSSRKPCKTGNRTILFPEHQEPNDARSSSSNFKHVPRKAV